MLIRFLIVILFLTACSNKASDELFLCEIKSNTNIQITFNSETKKANLIIPSSSTNGNVETTKHHYLFKFPKTETRHETNIIVNRYSGDLQWEHGSAPFGKANKDNVSHSGSCKKTEFKKVL